MDRRKKREIEKKDRSEDERMNTGTRKKNSKHTLKGFTQLKMA